MTSGIPLPLALPADAAGWTGFATTRQDDRLAAVRAVDDRLRAGSDLSGTARLDLWNDAAIALDEVLSESYLLSEAHPDSGIRSAAEQRVQAAESLAAERAVDRGLWRALADIDAAQLDPSETRLLQHALRDFRRAGVELDDAGRAEAQRLAERDTELSLTFSRNVREGRREIRVAPEALAGLPQDFIEAHPVGDDGLVVLTTEYTDLMPVREYARDRATRLALVGAYNDLAWPENETVLADLLEIRAQRAALLGYADWAEYETETRMIGSGAAIPEFLTRLAEASGPAALREHDRLLARLRQDEPDADSVTTADFWYLISTVKREEYAVDAQEVRSYFPFDRVLPGVLDVTGRLLGLEYTPVDVATWHEDVRSYDVLRDGERIGRIHLDLHPREGKYSHAACFPLAPGIAGRVLPEGVLLCNFSRGLLEHDEVITFFHEFGHLVHYILGGVDARFAAFTGFETEWDFVEAPSQLLEEWAWDAEVLASFTRGPDGGPIPAELVARMRTADAFGRALEVSRQLGHANVSYHLHVDRPADLQAATEHWYRVSSPVRPVPGQHPYAGFGHLTGYGSCYYTYQWSLVIARDLLTGFAHGLMDPDAAARYRDEVLRPGGGRDAADMVEAFLGRPFAFDAYRAWLAGG